MIPFLFEKDFTQFDDVSPSTISGALMRLTDCISCRVTEERNGIYECELRYPANGRLFNEIKPGRIICVSHDVGGDLQPFDIYAYRVDIDGTATFFARHISYRLNRIVLDPVDVTTFGYHDIYDWVVWMIFQTGKWFNTLKYGYSFTPDISYNAFSHDTFHLMEGFTGKLFTVREAIIGTASSIVERSGGEVEWDINHVIFKPSRGTDTTVVIRAGFNLNALTYEYDRSEMTEEIAPYYTISTAVQDQHAYFEECVYLNGDNDPQDSSGQFVLSSDAVSAPGENVKGFVGEMLPLDITGEFLEPPKQADLFERAVKDFNNLSIIRPRENVTISFVPLWESPEYEYIAPAEKLKLCDTATVIIPEVGFSSRMKVVKVVWDVLLERYVSMDFGSLQRTIYGANTVGGTAQEADPYADIDPSTYIDPTGL